MSNKLGPLLRRHGVDDAGDFLEKNEDAPIDNTSRVGEFPVGFSREEVAQRFANLKYD